MNNFYCVTYKVIKVFKVSDEEMRRNGYEDADVITDEMREEYLDSLIEEYPYNDRVPDEIEVEKMTVTKEEEEEILKKGAYTNA